MIINKNQGFESRGFWFYKLPDPFRNLHYLPIDAVTLAEQLEISYKTALKICKGERALKKSDLTWLQILNFGLIPDKQFQRFRLAFSDGQLICHSTSTAINAGELASLQALKLQMLRLEDELNRTKARIAELEEPEQPTNVIRFADYK